MLLVLFMWEIGTQQLGSRTFLKKEFIWSDIIITILLLVFVCGLVNGWRWVRFLVRWGSLPLPIWLWIAEISDKFTPPTEKFRIFAKPWMDSVLQMSLLTLWLIVGVFYLLGRTSAKAYFAPLPKGERRFGRFQFSMKSFLLFIAVLTIPLGPLSIYAQTYREQGNRTLNGLFSGVFRFGR